MCLWNIPTKLLLLSLPSQNQASEAMEVFNELMESEVSIIVPHVADIVRFFLEVRPECVISVWYSKFYSFFWADKWCLLPECSEGFSSEF